MIYRRFLGFPSWEFRSPFTELERMKCNIGCRTGASIWRILKENLEKKLGVPSLTIDCDILDPTYSPRPIDEEQMDRFFEMVAESKSYKERRKTA